MFTVGSCDVGKSGAGRAIHHTIDHSVPLTTTQARSLDGGATWTTEPIPARVPGGVALSADEHTDKSMKLATVLETEAGRREVQDCPGDVPLQHPDFALLGARTGLGPGTRSIFYYSVDRCRSWLGPFALPSFGQTGLAARTDYVVLGPKSVLLLLSANKSNGREGKVCCVRSDDGCRTWALQSFVDADVEPIDEQIMPASLQIPGGPLLVATRCCGDGKGGRQPTRQWIDIYRSDNEGRSFRHVARPVDQASRAHGEPA